LLHFPSKSFNLSAPWGFKKFPKVPENFHFFPRIGTFQWVSGEMTRKKFAGTSGRRFTPAEGRGPPCLAHIALARRLAACLPDEEKCSTYFCAPKAIVAGY
jgi:hypothetical protein